MKIERCTTTHDGRGWQISRLAFGYFTCAMDGWIALYRLNPWSAIHFRIWRLGAAWNCGGKYFCWFWPKSVKMVGVK
jgi:hypothetical protein